jgi:transposase
MLVAEKNLLGLAAPAMRPRHQAYITWLEGERQALDQDVGGTLRHSPVWWEQEDLLRSVPGVGPQLARTPLAHLPELETLDRKPLAALGGCPLQPRQWHPARQADGLGWTGPCARASLYGRARRQPA